LVGGPEVFQDQLRQSASAVLVSVVVLAVATFSPLAGPGSADAAEVHCNELGANCVCSSPLNQPSSGLYTEGPTDYWRPSNAGTNECSQDGTGRPVVRTSPVLGTNDAAMKAALPSGNSVSTAVRPQDNDHQGTFMVGMGESVPASFTRLAARFYIYHSPVFDFKGEGTCQNSKQTEHDGESRIDVESGAGFHIFNFLTWSPSIDCCGSGPAINQPNLQQMKGKWWRHEIVFTNRSGPRFRLQSFMKNVTDNTPEIAVIDFHASGSPLANMTPPKLMSMILSNNHRWSPAGGCRGWIALSHYMMAGWTSDAGQRIGAAGEIEGGGGGGGVTPPPTSPPAAPTNPRISLSDPKIQLSGFVSPIVLVVSVGGLVLMRRRRRE
jgi:hypothetical protein